MRRFLFSFRACAFACSQQPFLTAQLNVCRMYSIHIHALWHTHTLVIKLVLQWGFCVQYVFISCLVLHLITGKSHGCTEFSNLSFGSAEENPTPLLFPAFKIFLCNWINDEHKKKKKLYTDTKIYLWGKIEIQLQMHKNPNTHIYLEERKSLFLEDRWIEIITAHSRSCTCSGR